jgi:hypothetical protein
MMVDREDPYVLVNCTLRVIRPRAVFIECDNEIERWIPRACLHGGSDSQVADADPGDTLVLKMKLWKAKQENLPYADIP